MTTITSNRILFLDWLRAIACLMVMTVHACECIYSNDYSFHFATEADLWWVSIVNGLMRPAVPLFLIASAYLLVPVKSSLLDFFRRRLSRVFIPFLVWLVLYAVLPSLWGEWSMEESIANLSQVLINFIPRESHLWFIYMLLGIYMIMPILSPWLEKCSRRDEQVMLGIWLFTSLFWRLHEAYGDIFGECWWNPWPTFHYVSGYVGYVVLAHYIRTYIHWGTSKTLRICLPLFLLSWGWCIYSFYTRSFYVDQVSSLEIDWQTTSFAPLVMSFSLFMIIRCINCPYKRIQKAIFSISKQSYGMYLMHMMMLPSYYKLFDSYTNGFVLIASTAFATYVSSFLLTWLLSKIPLLRRSVG